MLQEWLISCWHGPQRCLLCPTGTGRARWSHQRRGCRPKALFLAERGSVLENALGCPQISRIRGLSKDNREMLDFGEKEMDSRGLAVWIGSHLPQPCTHFCLHRENSQKHHDYVVFHSLKGNSYDSIFIPQSRHFADHGNHNSEILNYLCIFTR